jgi:molybdate transport system ATP-binding protein
MLDVRIRKQLESFELDVAFRAQQGITALLGQSGAGKSMTLACIAGLETPETGRITLGDEVFLDAAAGIDIAARRRRVGYVMQDYLLFPHLNVGANVAFGLKGLSRSERDAVVAEALARVGLDGYAERVPSELSGGQQQRVALARALVTDPQVLLLDEPFSALDAPTRAVLRRDLLELQRTLGVPVVFVTHDLAEAYLLADQIVVIESGRVLQIGPPGAIVYHPATRSVARLTGNNNFFEGQVVEPDPAGARIRVGDVTLIGPPMSLPSGMPVELGIRPERIMLLRKDLPVGKRSNILDGRVVNELTDGFNYTLFFRLAGGQRLATGGYDLEITLPAYVYERLHVADDKEWSVTVRRNDIHVFGAG